MEAKLYRSQNAARNPRRCSHCRIPLTAQRTTAGLCDRCYTFGRGAALIEAATKLFKSTRPQR
jgi:hypothetical protein